jgi:hypothetical protein
LPRRGADSPFAEVSVVWLFPSKALPADLAVPSCGSTRVVPAEREDGNTEFIPAMLAAFPLHRQQRDLPIRELVAAFIPAIIKQDLFELVLQHHSVEGQSK